MRRVLSLAALSILALSSTASAQRSGSVSTSPTPEIGMDAGIRFRLTTPSRTDFDLPMQQIRMGFFISPVMSIEPTVGLASRSGGGGASVTAYDIGAGLPDDTRETMQRLRAAVAHRTEVPGAQVVVVTAVEDVLRHDRELDRLGRGQLRPGELARCADCVRRRGHHEDAGKQRGRRAEMRDQQV